MNLEMELIGSIHQTFSTNTCVIKLDAEKAYWMQNFVTGNHNTLW